MIMKKMNKLMLGALLMAGATACTNDDLPLQDNAVANQGKAIITALTPQSGSRVAFEDDGQQAIKLNWKASGETFSVAVKGENDSYSTYTYTQVSGNTFAGDAYTVTPGPYYAFYPARENMLPTNILTDYSSQTGALDENLTYMYAVADELNETTELQFQHISAILKATFKCGDEDITSKLANIQLALPEDVLVGTDNQFDMTTGDFLNYSFLNLNKIIYVAPDQASSVYIYVPGSGLTSGQVIGVSAVDTDEKIYTGTITLTKDIVAGKVYVGEVNLNASQATPSTTWTSETVASPMLLGLGTDEEPFLIRSAEDLQWLVENVSATQNKHFKLTKNLTIDSNANAPWTPIGKEGLGNSFTGVFNGNNCTISGSLISGSTPPDIQNFQYYGLFGNAFLGGIIHDLTVDATVEVNYTSISAPYITKMYTGGIAGTATRIFNCTFKGSVKGGCGSMESHTGGIAGTNTLIENCTNEGDVTGGESTEKCLTGGISGYINFGRTAINSTNKGKVTGGIGGETSYTGGIGGQAYYTDLTGCHNEGTVTAGTGTGIVATGGLVGHSYESIICTCCTTTGTLPAIGAANDAAYENQTKVDGCTNTHP